MIKYTHSTMYLECSCPKCVDICECPMELEELEDDKIASGFYDPEIGKDYKYEGPEIPEDIEPF